MQANAAASPKKTTHYGIFPFIIHQIGWPFSEIPSRNLIICYPDSWSQCEVNVLWVGKKEDKIENRMLSLFLFLIVQVCLFSFDSKTKKTVIVWITADCGWIFVISLAFWTSASACVVKHLELHYLSHRKSYFNLTKPCKLNPPPSLPPFSPPLSLFRACTFSHTLSFPHILIFSWTSSGHTHTHTHAKNAQRTFCVQRDGTPPPHPTPFQTCTHAHTNRERERGSERETRQRNVRYCLLALSLVLSFSWSLFLTECVRPLSHTRTQTHTHSHTHTLTHSNILTHAQRKNHGHYLSLFLTHSHTHKFSQSHTHTFTLLHSLSHTRTLSHTHPHTHTLTHSHTHTLTHSHTHTLTHSLTHTLWCRWHTQKRKGKCRHTHIQRNTQAHTQI